MLIGRTRELPFCDLYEEMFLNPLMKNVPILLIVTEVYDCRQPQKVHNMVMTNAFKMWLYSEGRGLRCNKFEKGQCVMRRL